MSEPISIKSTDKPLNKSEAYHLARLLITAPDTVSAEERRGLLLHFAPTAGRVPKSSLEYVAQFVSKPTDVRYYLQYLHSDGKRLWASDGHTAAWCSTVLPAGFYHPRTGDPVDVDGKFPDIERVIPTRREQLPLALEDWPGEERLGIKSPELRLVSPSGIKFHRDYILRALKGTESAVFQDSIQTDSSYTPLRGSVKIKGTHGTAQFIVMPIRE